MVTAANRMSRPVTGCDQVFCARESIAAWSPPRVGGELKSKPITENRNRAHSGAVELGFVGIITSPQRWGEWTTTNRFHRSGSASEEHPLRIAGDHCETLICRPPATVIGERNRRRNAQPWDGG